MDPTLKDALYLAVSRKGLSLKGWFVSKAREVINEDQLTLPMTTRKSAGRRR
jgi:hypothetical protein